MCPDMRMPLNTRDGNADEPIEPVIWNIEPCEAAPPAKVMPLDYARESAALAGRNHIHKPLTVENVHQHLVAGLGSVRLSPSTTIVTSRRKRIGGRLCLAKCPFIAFVSRDSLVNSTSPI